MSAWAQFEHAAFDAIRPHAGGAAYRFILAVWSARKPKDLKIGTSGR
jgi:hypothetical protein